MTVTVEKTKEPGIVKRLGPRGVSFICTISIGVHPNGTRKQIRRSFPTFAAAKDWKTKTNHERRTGSYIVPSRETVGDYLERWLEGLRGRVKPNTLLVYRQSRFRLSTIHHVPLAEVTTPLLHRTQQAMVTAGMAKSSISLTFKVLRIAINDALADRMLAVSPFVGFKGVTSPRMQPKRLTSEEVALFFAAIADDPHRALWEVAFETGMRFGELVSLRWSEVDLARKTIAVVRTLTRTEGCRIVEGRPKSDAGERVIAISDDLVAVLRQHRAYIDNLREIKPGWNPLDLVFPAESGPYLGNKLVNDWLREACERAGVTPCTIHSLRHTSGSMQAEAGIPIKTITQRLGHHHPAITLQLYVHPDQREHERAASTMQDALRKMRRDEG